MAKNAYRGEAPIKIGDETYRLVFDWNALAALRSSIGKSPMEMQIRDLTEAELAMAVVVGTARYHGQSLSVAAVMAASPPWRDVVHAVTQALLFAYWGPDGPPKASADITANP